MPAAAELQRFYDASYSKSGEQGMLYARWRTLSAAGKADHVMELCRRAGVDPPRSTLEVGCGDGALLSELHHRGFGGELHGVEITEAAVRIASPRSELASVQLYDGEHLPAEDHRYDLGILSHVLEHVPQPAALLAETARACRVVVVEVPLEANLSARRDVKRAHAEEIGHLQRLSRTAMRGLVDHAGLRIAAELDDPLPRPVHTFFADTPPARATATAKWLVRTAIHRAAPDVARRLFTVHYACLCLPAG